MLKVSFEKSEQADKLKAECDQLKFIVYWLMGYPYYMF